jgi:Asp/Glu/hydantoin racemase
MIEGRFPRPPGAIGNASTFPFPVLHHVVKGFSGRRTVRDLGTLDPDSHQFQAEIRPWTDGAKYLQDQGCRAITTSCGYAALFQKHLTEAVDIPVFASSLLLVPLITRMLKRAQFVGIITAEVASLSERHLLAADIDTKRVKVLGMDGCAEFAATAWDDVPALDFDRARAETVDVARRLVQSGSDIGAILLECSLLPPYATDIQRAINVPVFDFTHLVNMVHNACARTDFSGLL